MSNNWIYSSKLCFLKKHPQFFHSGSSARIMGIFTTGSAVKNHISPKMARELIAICQTKCHSQSLVYRRVPLQHSTPISSGFSSQDSVFDVRRYAESQCPKEVEVRVKSYGETRCLDKQKPKTKTKIKMKDATKHTAIYCMTCRTGSRSSEKNWSTKVVL